MNNEKVVLFNSKDECCGCGACENICPKNTIEMIEDKYGFIYPIIDEAKCIKCNLCNKVCAYQNSKLENTYIESYAAISKTTNLKESASGGAFSAIAEAFILDGGYVFGASLEKINNKINVTHTIASNIEELRKLKGSKYVQSEMKDTYTQIRKLLMEGNKVLFSGTPCQCDALRYFIGKKSDNLYIMDIICHGIPNNKLFNDYISFLETKFLKKISNFSFRSKEKGWGSYNAMVEFYDKTKTFFTSLQSSYYYLFLSSYIYRQNCYSCKYASSNRVSDITIGDYWGVENEHVDFLGESKNNININDGISCVIINSKKGQELFEKYKSSFIFEKSSIDKMIKYNKQLVSPCSKPTERQKLLDMYTNKGYVALENWFLIKMKKRRIFNIIKQAIPNRIIYLLKSSFKKI